MICFERTACCCLAALVCVALAGCDTGGSGIVATGRVLEGGRPVAIPDFEKGENCLEVEFYPLDEAGVPGGPSYAAPVGADGSFEVKGPMAEGIPPGKYRVTVTHIGGEEDGDDEDGDEEAASPWAKFNKENSPFEFQVPGSEIVIDISQAAD
jgi:hypothetical protein